MSQSEARTESAKARYRIWFTKRGVLRYTSHLDLARIWERALRRASAPLAYSQGFNPRPKMQLAAALPLGYESSGEVLDAWLEGADTPSPEALRDSLNEAVPEGLHVDRVDVVELRSPALQTLTQAAVYTVLPRADGLTCHELEHKIDDLLSQKEILRERRNKRYDLRPLIYKIDVTACDDASPSFELTVSLSASQGTGRPDEVLGALGFDPFNAQVTRTAILFES